MTLLRHDRHLVFFAHVPKTGGSSVESALRAAGAKRALHYHQRMGFTECNLQHMHAALYEKLVPRDFYDYGLAVIRHPFARLVSEFKWRIQLEQVSRPFDAWVQRHLGELVEKNPYVLDNHIRPQAEFIGKKMDVFRFENGLQEPLNAAASALGLASVDTSTHVRSGGEMEVEWSPETRARALDFYARDFEEFSYDVDEPIRGLRLL